MMLTSKRLYKFHWLILESLLLGALIVLLLFPQFLKSKDICLEETYNYSVRRCTCNMLHKLLAPCSSSGSEGSGHDSKVKSQPSQLEVCEEEQGSGLK